MDGIVIEILGFVLLIVFTYVVFIVSGWIAALASWDINRMLENIKGSEENVN